MDNSSIANIQSMGCNSEVYSTINAAVEHDNDADAWKRMFEDWKNLSQEGNIPWWFPVTSTVLYGFVNV